MPCTSLVSTAIHSLSDPTCDLDQFTIIVQQRCVTTLALGPSNWLGNVVCYTGCCYDYGALVAVDLGFMLMPIDCQAGLWSLLPLG